MSAGMLHGLAERALGVAQTLRSQQALRSASAPHEDRVPEAETLGPVRDAAALPSGGSVARAAWTPVQAGPIHEARPRVGGADSQPAMARRNAASVEAPAVAAEPLRPVAAPTPVAAEPEALVSYHRETPALAERAAVPAVHAQEPAPLLPPQPAAWPDTLLQPTQRTGPSESVATGNDNMVTAERPTEVHVSIGRVELVALAPAANPARPAPRQREASVGLADYLLAGARGKP